MELALVLHDHATDVTAGVLLATDRFAFDDVLVADLTADFGENRNAVRIPFAEDVAGFTVWFSATFRCGPRELRTSRVRVPCRSRIATSPLRVSTTRSVRRRWSRPSSRVSLSDAACLGDLVSCSSTSRRAGTADVERTHRQLRARFADLLGGDDADGHSFFDHRTGRRSMP